MKEKEPFPEHLNVTTKTQNNPLAAHAPAKSLRCGSRFTHSLKPSYNATCPGIVQSQLLLSRSRSSHGSN